MGKRLFMAALGLMLLTGTPLVAHHAFSAEFNPNAPVKLQGPITKVELINPHAWIYIDVKNTDGTVTNWMVEAGAPNALLRRGWTKNSLLPGTEYLLASVIEDLAMVISSTWLRPNAVPPGDVGVRRGPAHPVVRNSEP